MARRKGRLWWRGELGEVWGGCLLFVGRWWVGLVYTAIGLLERVTVGGFWEWSTGSANFFCGCESMLGHIVLGDPLAEVDVLSRMPCRRPTDRLEMVKHGPFLGFAPLVLADSAFRQSRIRLRAFSGGGILCFL